MVHEPSKGEMVFANFALKTYLRSRYSRFVRNLHLSGDEEVMEYGSGPGVMSKMIARRLSKGRLTCVDASKNWMEDAKRNLRGARNVDFMLGDVGQMKFPRIFDLIVIHYVLHEVPQSQRAGVVSVLSSNLKVGGRICIREPTVDPPHGMPAEEIVDLMLSAGLTEVFTESKGSVFSAEFRTSEGSSNDQRAKD
jgi:tRNA A58 N-methylase Trm61